MLIIYGGIAILVLVTLINLFIFHRKVVWWEHLVNIAVIMAVTGICKLSSESSATVDTQTFNYHAKSITYYEDWNERVLCSHPEYCTRSATCYGTDSDGKSYSYTCTETYFCGWKHPYDVDYHPERWVILDNNDNKHRTKKEVFEKYSKLWNSRVFKDMKRDYHTNDGDAYVTTYNGDTLSLLGIAFARSYENRVQASHSVFNFKKIEPENAAKLGLFNYPTNYDNYPYILGDNNDTAMSLMRYYNGAFGMSKKMHSMILVFTNKPYQVALDQEAYWTGGNKNEFILCVGKNSNGDIEWTKVISWTKNRRLITDVTADVHEMGKYDIVKITRYFGDKVSKNYDYRSFKEFSYLRVEPSTTATVVSMIVIFVVAIGMSIFMVLNPINRDSDN